MASYHCSIKTDNKSITASEHTKYICREGKYSNRKDLEYKEHNNMPLWAQENPNEFWQAADDYERANGRRYNEIEVALPNEFNAEQRLELVREFVREQLGEVHTYSLAIHCPKANFNPNVAQPHAHIVFCERVLDGVERSKELFFKRANSKKPEIGGATKDQSWHNKNKVIEIRKSWEITQNRFLEKYGHEVRVDCRSLKAQRDEALIKGDYEKAAKLDRVPEQHLGPKLANRTMRLIDEHLKDVSKENFQEKRAEYYEKIEPSQKMKQVADIRELKRTEEQIESIEKKNPELAKSKIDTEQAKKFAEVIYLENKLKDLKPQLEEIQKQRSQFFKDLQAYQKSMPDNPTSDEKKKFNQESIDLKIKIKELKEKEAEIKKEIEQVKQSVKTPEAQAEIKKISEKIQVEQEQKIENNKIQYRERLAQERRIAFLENKRTPFTEGEAKELATARYLEQIKKPYKLQLDGIQKERKEFNNQLKEHQNNAPVNPSPIEKKEYNQQAIDLKIQLKELHTKEEEVNKQMEASAKEDLNKPEAQKEIDRIAEEILKQSRERTEKEQQLKSNQQEQYKLKREQEKAAEKATWERRFELEHKKTPLTEGESKELAIDRYLERATESKQTELEQVKHEKIDYIKELRSVQDTLNKSILEVEERKRLEREDKDLKTKLKDLKAKEVDLKKEIEREKESLLNQEKVKQDIERQAKEIYKESFMKNANEKQIESRLEEIDKAVRKYDFERAEVNKNLYTEKQAENVARSIFTNGATTELIKERAALNKEQQSLEEKIKQHQENKPKMFDFEGKKTHENEAKRLEELKKDFEQRYKDNTDKVEKMKEQLQKPEAIKQVESIKQSVLQRNISRLEKIDELDKKLSGLRSERAQLQKRQFDLGQERSMKREIERNKSHTQGQKNSNSQSQQQQQNNNLERVAGVVAGTKQMIDSLDEGSGPSGGLSIRISHDDDNHLKDDGGFW